MLRKIKINDDEKEEVNEKEWEKKRGEKKRLFLFLAQTGSQVSTMREL